MPHACTADCQREGEYTTRGKHCQILTIVKLPVLQYRQVQVPQQHGFRGGFGDGSAAIGMDHPQVAAHLLVEAAGAVNANIR